MNINEFRKKEHGVQEIFLHRWSPRAMSGRDVDEATLLSLFEAARWAPSSNNNQPWRFIYARRNTPFGRYSPAFSRPVYSLPNTQKARR